MRVNRPEALPVGRRVAYWRVRRKLSQQVFADRLGKSKSWVDKIERGVRSLDKVSTLQAIAAVLRVDTAVLLGRDIHPVEVTERVEDVERIRAALSRYEIPLGRPAGRRPVLPVDRMAREVAHVWTTFQYARYPQVVDLLPDLLTDAQRTHAHDSEAARVPLVEAYRITAALLVKLGDADLAWLAADRAMIAATGDRVLVAAAAVQLGQVLRESGWAREATSAMRAAAYRIAPPVIEYGSPIELSLCGTLLVQAALAAARYGDDAAVTELLDEAADLAERVGDGQDHHRTGFGPTAVALARATAAVDLGDARDAVTWHEKTIQRGGWRCLPVEHRAAHLVDAARAYLEVGDPVNAGRVLVDAARIAPAEVRHRPTARDVLAQVARDPDAPATVTQLADTLGVG
ncbi:XRE family transcriptional regulator [Micromonospora echinospora]|uniref:Transcriptional regulator, contains XRE-family HTH domain n=1 Tax=Micromonospora echinospora TaxID=1877 RepID=A0A1C4VMW3_MICEC|nr:helix-turn-helix domain-containing protein [Micromonospora echinospora]OZV76718.1 XRE family transcriptional regulator [Micromonospora echinospora]SCE85099.1 Transcriptional regulator, contains XRE-family HTH domain [Micromonospora echinospora]